MTKSEAAERVRVMNDFLDSAGWKAFVEYMQGYASQLEAAVLRSASPDEAWANVASIKVAQRILAWPVQHAKQLQEALVREEEIPGQGGFDD